MALKAADAGGVSAAHQVAEPATIEAARQGDRDALGEIWRIYQPQLLRMLRAKRALSPEDIASAVWIDVGRGLARFEGNGRDLQRWIFTIAGRRSIDAGRTNTREQDRRQALASTVDGVHVDAEPGSLDHAIAMVAALPPTMAEAVMLRVVHDLAVDEAAAIMNTSEGNVRVLVHRGLAKLRATLDSPHSDPPSEPVTRPLLAPVPEISASL